MKPFHVLAVGTTARTLVEASAGTGKTFAISTLVVRLLLERDLTLDQILVVTFTEAATAELKLRIRQRLTDALALCTGGTPKKADGVLAELIGSQRSAPECAIKLRRALASFDDVGVFTIHGFCHRVLRENAFETGASPNAELLQDTRALSREVAFDFWARHVATAKVTFVEQLEAQRLTPSALSHFSDFVSRTRPLAVVPQQVTSQGEPDLGALREAFDAAKDRFEPERIVPLLQQSGLHGARYPADKIAEWCVELTTYFHLPRVSVIAPRHLDRFGNERINAARTKKTRELPRHPFFDAVDALLRQHAEYDARSHAAILRFKRQLIEYVQHEVPERKRALGVLSFDDLLHHLESTLSSPSGRYLAASLKKRFPVALIDEFQDTDPTQYSIFDRIYSGEHSALFMIGDPKQAIYSFRGADVFAYVDAARSVASERQLTMTTNYRSAPQLVHAVNKLFSSASRPFYLDAIAFPGVHPSSDAKQALELPGSIDPAPFQWRYVHGKHGRDKAAPELGRSFRQRVLPRLVAAEVAQLLDSTATLGGRPLTPKDFAVLTRTNAEAFDCQRALLSRGIAAVVLGDRSVYEYDEARELELLLSAILEPGNPKALRAALITSMLGVSANALEALDRDESAWDAWVERFRSWNQRWLSQGFVQAIRMAMDDCGVAERLLQLDDGERRMTNLLHLIELLHTEAKNSHLGPSGLLHYLVEQRTEQSHLSDSEQIRLESDEDAVVLTTIHKSKGLEYPIVVCPTLHNGMVVHPADKDLIRFHDPNNRRALTLDLGGPEHAEHEAHMAVEALAENTRLLYVALTRAQYRCVVFWGPFTQFYQSALAYVLHGDDARNSDAPPTLEELKRHLKNLTNQDLRERLSSLDPSGKFMCVSDCRAQDDSGSVPAAAARADEPMTCREVDLERRAHAMWQRTSSFSALSSGAMHAADPLEGRDHDVAAPERFLDGSEEMPVTLAEFAGGKAVGNLFHSMLEHCDFPDFAKDGRATLEPADADAIAETSRSRFVEGKLKEHGMDATHAPLLERALCEILSTEFMPGLRLSMLDKQRRLDEMEFTLPTGPSPITASVLANLFERHAPSDLTAYAERVARLHFAALSGFLKGYIDLIFVHESKWYVVDYKTNNLGFKYADYDPRRLATAMMDSHYVLQYHLYAVALERYLRLRLRDYSRAQHFGGVYYLFLRGMHPDHGGRFGTYADRPSDAMLDALGALFGPQDRGGAS